METTKSWHGVMLGQPDWSVQSHSVAASAELRREGIVFYLILNAYWEPLEFELPPVNNNRIDPWLRWIDTALESPDDIVPWQKALPTPGYRYRAESRSVVVLFAELRTRSIESLSRP
jgi:glycogen operon protein